MKNESFTVMDTLQCLQLLATLPDGFYLYTDHNNLIYIFEPLSLMTDIGIDAVRKLLSWAVRIPTHNYVSVHIPGGDNTWADLRTH